MQCGMGPACSDKYHTCMPGGGCSGCCWWCCGPAGDALCGWGRGPRAGADGVITTVGAGAGPGRAVPDHASPLSHSMKSKCLNLYVCEHLLMLGADVPLSQAKPDAFAKKDFRQATSASGITLDGPLAVHLDVCRVQDATSIAAPRSTGTPPQACPHDIPEHQSTQLLL